jgi:hypothetical protein
LTSDIPIASLIQALSLANSLQTEFFFDRLAENDAAQFRTRSCTRVFAPDFLRDMENLRSTIGGYHPFLVAFIDSDLDGDHYSNLFAANRSEKGLGIVTIANVPDIIVPAGRPLRISCTTWPTRRWDSSRRTIRTTMTLVVVYSIERS